jgi:Tol biopolymer transport system component
MDSACSHARSSGFRAPLGLVLALAATLTGFLPAPALAGTTERVSVGAGGVQGNGDVDYYAVISADGRYVVFSSSASTLVPGDTNGSYDIFVRDRVTDTTTRVSVDSGGLQGNSDSYEPWISRDGRYVGYTSYATNLVASDLNGVADSILHDRQTAVTTLISATPAGLQGNDESWDLNLSADARYAAFYSYASNLVPGDNNGMADCFVRDLLLGTIQRVSTDAGGVEGNGISYFAEISADGRYVVFTSNASNFVPNDVNGQFDVFRRDLVTGALELVSVVPGGSTGNSWSLAGGWSVVSADGRYIAFASAASDVVTGDTNGFIDSCVRDMTLGITTRVSLGAGGVQGNDYSDVPSISEDGRYVTYMSVATNLVANDLNAVPDCFRFDRVTGALLRISVDSAGGPGNAQSRFPMPSADGRHIVFNSDASNLVPGDTNGVSDQFVFSDVWVTFKDYGSGLAGGGGFVPALHGTNGSSAAGGWSLRIDDVLGGATGALFVGFAPASVPLLGGNLLVSLGGPFLQVTLPVSGPWGLPGYGALDVPGADLSALVGLKVYLQFLAADPNAVKGVSMSNGLELDVVP